jgi:hypothetical protein
VPGDPSATKGLTGLKVVRASLRIPASCRAKPNWSPSRPDGTFFADVGPVGVKHQWTKHLNFWIGKSFTYTNHRHNLKLQTKGIAKDSQSHHTLPRAFEAKFKAAQLNIHDPQFLRWWCSKAGVKTNHQSNAAKYYALWTQFFAKYQKPTRAQVLKPPRIDSRSVQVHLLTAGLDGLARRWAARG